MDNITDIGKWQPGLLCDQCQPIFDHIQTCLDGRPLDGLKDREFMHHVTAAELMVSAAYGCHLCSLFFGAVFLARGFSPAQAREFLARDNYPILKPVCVKRAYHNFDGYSQVGGPRDGILEIVILGGWSATNMVYVVPQDRQFSGRVGMSDTGLLPDGLSDRALCGRSDEGGTLELARWWLNECSREHGECQTSSALSAELRPARLLDLSLEGDRIRVVTVPNDGEIHEYFALSYVWGTQECIRLTTETMADMQQFILISDLPKTIREAVAATKALGCSYLWVDSLCIIQDSKDDWATESVKMGGIYRRAKLTIAALHASGNHEGLFVNKNPLWARPILIPGTDCEISNTANYFIWEYDGQSVPLQRRAWVIQERFSAVRTLFFGASGLYWECLRCQASEWDMNGVFEPPNMNYKHNIHKALHPVMNDSFSIDRYLDHFLHIWGVVRKLYTSAELTYESDRPVAITGIAKLLADCSGFTNWQGVWIDLASADLCWKISRVDKDSKLLERFPSWSWLSVRGEVTPLISDHKYYKSWRESPKAYCVPPQEQMIGDARFRVGTPVDLVMRNVIRTTLHERPNTELTLCTSSRKVYLLSGTCFTLEAPPQDMLEFHSKERIYDEDSSDDGDSPEDEDEEYHEDATRTEWPRAYEWHSDRPVDECLHEAWFIYLSRFRSHDGNRIGDAGLIAARTDETGVFRRLGVFKYWVFRDASVCNYMASDGPDLRYLPPSPFADLEEVEWVHLI